MHATAYHPSRRRQSAAFSAAASAAIITVVSAAILTSSACGPKFSPTGPGDHPVDSASDQDLEAAAANTAYRPPRRATNPLSHDVLIGEMCPRAADGRPAVLPLFLRGLTWSADSDDVSAPIERRAARSFSVLAWDGRRAGVFSVVGAADLGLPRRAAIGAYAGLSPCALPISDTEHALDPTCVSAQAECGLAIAQIEATGSSGAPYEEATSPLDLPVAGACVSGGKLLVDLDDDQVLEAYPVDSFLALSREPSDEVLAVALENAQCAPSFARQGVMPAADPKHFQGMDLIGVIDLDTDGRKEIIVVYHYPDRRTWAVYSAAGSVARLELIAEAVPWSSR